MLKKIFSIIILLQLFFTDVIFTQNQNSSSEEAAIKSVVMNETKSFAAVNFEGMKDNWAHEKYVFNMFSSPNFYSETLSWDSVDAGIKTFFRDNSTSLYSDLTWSDWNIHAFENCAWVSYIQTSIYKDDIEKPYESREVRFLEKKNGSWKIVYLATANKTAFKEYQEYQAKIENNINEVGYKLLEEKKFEDAIDIFKKNVKLYPKSSNVYDSLGEAYMKNGDKELAIKNYQMSLELDPKNNNAKEMIEKLKEK
jgi:tetratricopeptide (TPR) repeat protein